MENNTENISGEVEAIEDIIIPEIELDLKGEDQE